MTAATICRTCPSTHAWLSRRVPQYRRGSSRPYCGPAEYSLLSWRQIGRLSQVGPSVLSCQRVSQTRSLDSEVHVPHPDPVSVGGGELAQQGRDREDKQTRENSRFHGPPMYQIRGTLSGAINPGGDCAGFVPTAAQCEP